MISDLDHIAIAVHSIQDSLPFFRDVLGMRLAGTEDVPGQKVTIAVLHAGEQHIELLEPLGADSPIARFLEKRGPGLHHLAFQVPDIEAAIAACQSQGLRMIDTSSRQGAGGSRIAFIHPASSGGLLTELVQRPS